MIYLIFALVSFLASVIGSICGIGGGVLIKPVMDAFHIFPVSTVSFLSGCIVLAMSIYSVINVFLSDSHSIDTAKSGWLGLGAAAGGAAGKKIFDFISRYSIGSEFVGAVQAAVLFFLTFATIAYTINRAKIKSKKVSNPVICCLIGMVLGTMSAFLGIGGGPINLVVLYYFFSMETKAAAQNSLYIIMISQLVSVAVTVLSGKVPDVSLPLLAGMLCCGIFGGVAGRKINKHIDSKSVNRLFICLLCIIMLVCCYNFSQFI